MTGHARLSALPEPAQRIVAWCIRGCALVADPGPRGRRYRLDAPAHMPAHQRPRSKPIPTAAAEAAIASGLLVGRGDGLFGDDTAQSWVAREQG